MTKPIDLEQMRVRRLEGVQAPPPPALQPILPQTASSIAPAERTEAIDASLPPVQTKKHYMLEIIDRQHEMERIAAKHGKIFQTDVTNDLHRMEVLNTKRMETLRTYAREVEKRETWSAVKHIGEYVLSTSTIILGYASLASGVAAIPGLAIMAGGALGITHRAVQDWGGWNKPVSLFSASREIQIKYGDRFDTWVPYASLGLGIGGAISAWSTGVLSLSQNWSLEKWVELCGGVVTASAKTGESIVQRRVLNIETDLQLNQTDVTLTKQEMQFYTADVRKMIELNEAISRIVKDAIAATGG